MPETHTPTTTSLTWRPALAEAHRLLREAVGGVPVDAWRRATPCAEWNVAQVLHHALGDQIAYTAALTGGDGPSWNPFQPSGDLGADPAAALGQALTANAAAWAAVADDAADVPNPLPQGPLPAWLAAGADALDAAVHAWDIAVATGNPSPLTPDLAGFLLTVAQEIVEPLRAYGAYGPVVTAAPDPVAALLGYLGRDPNWAA
ncbi:MAG TPA: TIGR03086 family metal-binding protein [Streptosporangiaceae bacterium]|jgi:uncharacterized protein (TIGR03086 family)